MLEIDRMTVLEAAQAMHVSPQFIRMGLRSKTLTFGWAVKTGANRYTYYIVRSLFVQAMSGC